MNETYPYPYSAAEARKRNELSLWRESHKANIVCRDAIEDAIRQNFDGMNLQTDCLKAVLDEYGYKRTAWVLAIWMAYTYLNPLSSVGPGSYVLWQNIINSYQLWKKRKNETE